MTREPDPPAPAAPRPPATELPAASCAGRGVFLPPPPAVPLVAAPFAARLRAAGIKLAGPDGPQGAPP